MENNKKEKSIPERLFALFLIVISFIGGLVIFAGKLFRSIGKRRGD